MTACARTGYWRGWWAWSGRWSRRCGSRTTRSWCGCGRGGGTRPAAGSAAGGRRGYDRGEGAAPLAGARSRRDEGVRGGGRAAGRVPPARRRGRPRRLGAAREPVHAGVRAAGGVAGDALLEERGLRADADQLADGRPDHRAGRRRRAARRGDPLEGLRRIGIDELSFRKGQRYITVVVDHDTGRLVWASEGRDKQTVLALLRPARRRARRPDRARLQRSGRVDHPRGARALPAATLCLDPYHVVALATAARSTRCAARSGSRPAAPATRAAPAGSKAPAGRSGNDPND